nr:1511_t:CDS:2 [Entrophospora candida]
MKTKKKLRLHLSTPIVNNCKIYESNDDDIREVCDYSEYNSSTGIDSTSEEIDMQSDDDDEIEITREGERWNSIINEWIIMVQQENQFHDDDEYMYSSELEIGFELEIQRSKRSLVPNTGPTRSTVHSVWTGPLTSIQYIGV